MTPRTAGTALGLALAAEAAVFALGGHLPHHDFATYCASVPLFAIAVWLLARTRPARQHALLLILAAGTVFQLIALTHHPATSDDSYRYIWDAKVQLAGIDPYRYPPQAPQLTPLRDHLLFPPPPCPHPIPHGCTVINRPAVRTIYPPVAEAAFTAIRLASLGGHGGQLPIQLAAALGCLAIALLLARHALARGRPLWTVALWAWCPLPVLEYGNAGHIDWLAVAFSVLALTLAARRRSGLAGLLAGAAIATKLYPALIVPAMLRRRPTLVLSAAAGLVALSYLPHLLAVGPDVLGYLPGYLHEQGYTSGTRLALLGWLLPHPADTLIGAALIALVAIIAWRHANPDAPEHTSIIIMGTALLIATPDYGWYAGLLLALTAMTGRLEWLPVTLIPTFGYLLPLHASAHTTVLRLLYLAATLVAATISIRGRHRDHTSRSVSPPARPARRPGLRCSFRAMRFR